MKKILLTFDVEEFDLPKEYNQKISETEMYETSKQGLDNLKNLLDKYSIKSTFFTTANFAKKYPQKIKTLSREGHEIACHGFCHSDSCVENLPTIKLAKREIEKITKKEIHGFRAPRWNLNNSMFVEQSGFFYDSSSHPIYLPGRYFKLNQKKGIHKRGNLIEIPLSTLPPNLSIFWLAFKNFPLPYSKLFTRINFLKSDYTMLLFHPWEFTDISRFKFHRHINSIHSTKLLKKFEKYISFCKKQKYDFNTIREYLSKKSI